MRVAQPVAAVAGLVLMVAPAVLDYAGTDAADVHRIVGPLAITVAVIAAWSVTVAVRWVALVLAPVLAIAPVVVDHPEGATWVGFGAAAALVASAPFGGVSARRFGGGWRALLGHGRVLADGRPTPG